MAKSNVLKGFEIKRKKKSTHTSVYYSTVIKDERVRSERVPDSVFTKSSSLLFPVVPYSFLLRVCFFFYSRLNPSLPQPLWPPKWKGHVNMRLCVQSRRGLSLVCRPTAIRQLLLKLGLELTSEERPHHLLYD